MASYNRVVLAGNLTRDVEIKHTPGGMAIAEIGLAVNDRRKDQSGQWVDEVGFFDVTAFGRTAEVISEYLGKGSNVLIEGKLKFEQWEKDGQKRSKVKIICDKMVMLGSKKDSEGGNQSYGGYTSTPAPADDEAPF